MPIKTFKEKIETRTMAEQNSQFVLVVYPSFSLSSLYAVHIFSCSLLLSVTRSLSVLRVTSVLLMLISMQISKSHVSSRMRKMKPNRSGRE